MSQRVTPPEAPVSERVTMINAFTVPLNESEHFLEMWKDNARALASQPGFEGLRLYRSLIDDAELRFINVAQWASGKALEQAHADPEWQAAVRLAR